MTPHRAAASDLRLLPWRSPDGKPCYLSTDDDGGHLSRLADDMEAMQMAMAEEVLGLARPILDDPASAPTEVRNAALRLAECTADVLRVAESRGGRLPTPVRADSGEGDPAPELPARTLGSGLWSSARRVEGAHRP